MKEKDVLRFFMLVSFFLFGCFEQKYPVALDLDKDGNIDVLFDDIYKEDGRIDTAIYDSDSNGVFDLFVVDADEDGVPDVFLFDIDEDSYPEIVGYDTDHNGKMDSVDTNNDGNIDAWDYNEDGIIDAYDTDNDSLPDYTLLDLESEVREWTS